MDYDPMLAAMLSQPWSNNACRGYVIYAMENCGFSPNDIRRVVAELYEVFDIHSVQRQPFSRTASTFAVLAVSAHHWKYWRITAKEVFCEAKRTSD